MYKNFFKRVLDILISGIALLLIGWFLIIIYLSRMELYLMTRKDYFPFGQFQYSFH